MLFVSARTKFTVTRKKWTEPGKPGLSSTPEQRVFSDTTQLIVRKVTLWCSPKNHANLCTLWSKVQKGSSGSVLIDHGRDRLWQRLRAITRVTATCALSASSPTCLHLFFYSFLKNETSCIEVLLKILSPIETCLFDKRKYFHSNHLMMQILNPAFATSR